MFKCCPNCGFQWSQRVDFLGDPNIVLIGYQVNFRELNAGIFLFNHTCNGTLGIHALDFSDMYKGPIFEERLTGSDPCPGHCLHEDDLRPCPAKCECGYVRHILQLIRAWPKAGGGSASQRA